MYVWCTEGKCEGDSYENEHIYVYVYIHVPYSLNQAHYPHYSNTNVEAFLLSLCKQVLIVYTGTSPLSLHCTTTETIKYYHYWVMYG